jgi:glycine/D-amino acid oxidase-like deaminating enzyme
VHPSTSWRLVSGHGAPDDTALACARIAGDGPLARDASTDVCIVGAGLAGLTAAYLLARDGTRSSSSTLPRSARARAYGPQRISLRRSIAVARSRRDPRHGRTPAKAAASHAAAIDAIERIVADERIACDFVRLDGHLFAAAPADEARLAEERDAAHEAGLTDVDLVESPIPTTLGTSLRYPGRPDSMPGVISKASARPYGASVVTLATPVQAVDVEEGDALRVRTADGPVVTAGAVVVATNTPFSTRVAFHVKQASYRTYAIAARIPHDTIPDALYWDTADPFHYVRCATGDGGDALLVVGGEDHKTGQDDDGPGSAFRSARWMDARALSRGRRNRRALVRAGRRDDGRLAFIGPMHAGSRVFVVTGDCGNGYTHATLAGLLLRDLIAGPTEPVGRHVRPVTRPRARPRHCRGRECERRVAARRLGASRRCTRRRRRPAGGGAIVRRGVTPVAVHRDAAGDVHELSAVCPHLGCIVRWNDVESSWDCPCHGLALRRDRRGLERSRASPAHPGSMRTRRRNPTPHSHEPAHRLLRTGHGESTRKSRRPQRAVWRRGGAPQQAHTVPMGARTGRDADATGFSRPSMPTIRPTPTTRFRSRRWSKRVSRDMEAAVHRAAEGERDELHEYEQQQIHREQRETSTHPRSPAKRAAQSRSSRSPSGSPPPACS